MPTNPLPNIMEIGFALYFRNKNKQIPNSATSIYLILLIAIAPSLKIPIKSMESAAEPMSETTAGRIAANTFCIPLKFRYL